MLYMGKTYFEKCLLNYLLVHWLQHIITLDVKIHFQGVVLELQRARKDTQAYSK